MARQYLTTEAVLNQVFSRIRDNSSVLRGKLLMWFNSLTVQVANEREWKFLEKSAALPVIANAITLPDDFANEVTIAISDRILTTQDRLTDQDAFNVDFSTSQLIGYTIDETSITFHAGATGTASLSYTARVTTYADDGAQTVFPLEFLPLFERALLSAFYEYDVDSERAPLSFQLDAVMMKKLKAVDNRRAAIPPLTRNGYRRG